MDKPMKNEIMCHYDKIVGSLIENNRNGHEYSLNEIDKIAYEILDSTPYYNESDATPIVKITRDFGLKTYKKELDANMSGCIYVNGETKDKYGINSIILVNKSEELFHQRFVLAHELAHYLFDYLGSEAYEKGLEFSDTYYKNRHETLQEKRVNRFAAAILMPEKTFIRCYNYSKSVDSNRMLAIMFLSRFFKTTNESIEKRIIEVIC